MKVLISAFLVVFLLGCVAVPSPSIPSSVYQTRSEFKREDVSWIDNEGTASIGGNSFLRQQNGGVVTCAGFQVLLLPAGAYADERIGVIYQSIIKGFKPSIIPPAIDEAHPDYLRVSKQTVCDVDGRFKFSGLAAGNYYVLSTVAWGVRPRIQGGHLMQQVYLDEGQVAEITMTE